MKTRKCIDCETEFEVRAGNHKRCHACAVQANNDLMIKKYHERRKTARYNKERQTLIMKNGVEIILNAFGREIANTEIYL